MTELEERSRGSLRVWGMTVLEHGADSSGGEPTPSELAYLVTLMRNGLTSMEFWLQDRSR